LSIESSQRISQQCKNAPGLHESMIETTYILPAKEVRLLGNFQPDISKTERHGQRDSSSDADQEYIYLMGSETSPSLRCKLLTEILKPSTRV